MAHHPECVQIVNKNFDCIIINDRILMKKQKVGDIWVHNLNSLVYYSLKTKKALED